MEVAKLSAPPNLQVRSVSCNESAIKRWLSSELEETVFSLTHELFMTQHHTVTLIGVVVFCYSLRQEKCIKPLWMTTKISLDLIFVKGE